MQRHKGEHYAAFLREWLQFVFDNVLVQFGERFFKQIWGFPMGSAVSPDAANVFMALSEDVKGIYGHAALSSLLPDERSLMVFGRLIDDYTLVLGGVSRHQVDTLLGSIDARAGPHLRITWQVRQDCMDTLDLHVFKAPDFAASRRLHFRTHQKLGNRYQYLPYWSCHPQAVLKALVKGELTRLAVTCSRVADFAHMRDLFCLRMLSRGFPREQLFRWAATVQYSVRERILYSPPSEQTAAPLYLKLQYDNVSAQCGVPGMLAALRDQLSNVYDDDIWQRMLVCWTKSRALAPVFMRAADC